MSVAVKFMVVVTIGITITEMFRNMVTVMFSITESDG